jgi:hypothetical protein
VKGNNRLFALLGYDGDFDLALLDVEDGIRPVALREDPLLVAIIRYGPLAVHGAKEGLHVEWTLLFYFSHIASYLQARSHIYSNVAQLFNSEHLLQRNFRTVRGDCNGRASRWDAY